MCVCVYATPTYHSFQHSQSAAARRCFQLLLQFQQAQLNEIKMGKKNKKEIISKMIIKMAGGNS